MIDIIIPHSAGDEYRKRNLFFIVKYYKEYLPDSNIIIVEQNTETDITEINNLVDLHLKLKIEEKLFCKSLLLNEGYKVSQNKYLIFNDTDCIINFKIMLNLKQLYEILDKYTILPYNKPVFNLNESQTIELIRDHKTFNYCASDLIRRACQSNGGIVMISSDNYYKIGGHDPRFIGWGGEDDAFYLKAVKILGLVRLNSDLFHLNHPRGIYDGPQHNPHYSINYNCYAEYLNDNSVTITNIINNIGFNHLKKPIIKNI